MSKFDVWAWWFIRLSGLMQGYIFGLLYNRARTLQEKMKIIQYTMSGYYLWSTPPEDLPREVIAKMLPLARLMLLMTMYNLADTITEITTAIIGGVR